MSDSLPASKKSVARGTVLVTGASGAIGRAICLAYARAGWSVAVHYHTRKSAARETVQAIHALGGGALDIQADVAHLPQVIEMINTCHAQFGRLDTLICAAGCGSNSLLIKTTSNEWMKTISTNLTGVFHCLKAVGPHFVKNRSGSIIILGSMASQQGSMGQTAYAATKAGLIGLMRTAAREWGSASVRINAVFPGWHPSPLTEENFPSREHITSTHVLGRTPDLVAVADAIVYLSALPDVSGQIFNLDSRISS